VVAGDPDAVEGHQPLKNLSRQRLRADRLIDEDDLIPAALMIEYRVEARQLGMDVRERSGASYSKVVRS
jgi:hypothetical protein